MYKALLVCVFLFGSELCAQQQAFTGFFNFTYNEDKGSVILEVPLIAIEKEFLYVNSLSAGIGSNDIGLDRGQLGSDRIVEFVKAGNKLLLIQSNQSFRAVSKNVLEQKAVQEAFAKSVIWGFEISETKEDVHFIDITKFLLRDAHGVVNRLKSRNQGSYKLDQSRSAVWMDRTRSFPNNSEFDALLTFTGEPKGKWIKSVSPSADAVTVHQHHSFIELPDDAYKPRVFHPYSGYNTLTYSDFATPIEEPLQKRFIHRHRLEKKNPEARISEPVEPIIYYVDPGCPEPVKSALIEGASWWDQAFQAAGYAPGTFMVKELPEGADMLDVRYNVIQWVHRSTRGWSYGSSISDPRTGEILKGHVSLGSLRVRQDFLIAQGILSPYGSSDTNHAKIKALALDRLRQLSAHEVGHTIGLSHNFASSFNNRASVMDYPHPLILLGEEDPDFENAYDQKIGDWDKITITYGYQDFSGDAANEETSLLALVNEAQKEGYLFISDSDSRPPGGAHPHAHLWDNGASPTEELTRLLELRDNAMGRFGEASIVTGTPLSELEKVFVPLYLMHRYQLEAVSKLLGGLNYQYFVKGDAYEHKVTPVSKDVQDEALHVILHSLSADQLKIPENVLQSIPPPAHGFQRDRETFSGRTNLAFDPLAPAESYINTAFEFILNKDRLTRIHRHHATNQSPLDLQSFLNQVAAHIFSQSSYDNYAESLNQLVQKLFFMHLIKLSFDNKVDAQVAAASYFEVLNIKNKYLEKTTSSSAAHNSYLMRLLRDAEENPASISLPELKEMPPGSPIGCNVEW